MVRRLDPIAKILLPAGIPNLQAEQIQYTCICHYEENAAHST